MSRILVVDDEASIGWAFREFLADDGHTVALASSAEEALELAAAGPFDAAMLDVRLPGVDGLTAMSELAGRLHGAPIVVMTAFGNLETAVKAIEGGAFDYLIKPFDLDQAGAAIRRALEASKSRPSPRTPAITPPPDDALLGSSPPMQALFKRIALVAATDVPVLITGESGTGKELVARAIHRHSHRRDALFLPINLSALSPGLVEAELFGHVRGAFTGATQDRRGLLELAAGGTVLLDEIGDVSPSLQVKLLRTLENREIAPVGDARPRPIDIRVVAATNRPLPDLVASGEFREDLFFRLGAFPITVPSLRDRGDDVILLAEHFLSRTRSSGPVDTRFSLDVRRELLSRRWPGNVRELRHAIDHAAILARGGPIRVEHLPAPGSPRVSGVVSPVEAIQADLETWVAIECERTKMTPVVDPDLYERYLNLVEPPLLKAALDRTKNNRAAAALLLGLHRATLRQKMKRYDLH